MSTLPDCVWAAGTPLQALLKDNKAMAAVEAAFMGAPRDDAVLAQPSDADCILFLGLVEATCAIGQHSVASKTAAKKKSAMADVEGWQARFGKTVLQGTPLDYRVYLNQWSLTRGTYNVRGERRAAPSSVRAQASFIATELDKHPGTAGAWNPEGNSGRGSGNSFIHSLNLIVLGGYTGHKTVHNLINLYSTFLT
jgi:hypothetical protein